MLEYMQNSRDTAVVDEATKEIDKCVNNVRLNPEMRGKYMTFGEKLDRTYIEGHEEGRKEGQERLLIKLVCSRILRGMSAGEISRDLEVDESEISRICEAAEKYAPEYDQDAIFAELQKVSVP